MNRQARVSVAYATVKVRDAVGVSVRGFHQGAVFPDSADPDAVAALVRRGYAEWVDEVEPEAPDAVEPTAEETDGASEGVFAVAATPPAQSAPKVDWVAYAVSQGADYAEAEATTKADLITQYGG